VVEKREVVLGLGPEFRQARNFFVLAQHRPVGRFPQRVVHQQAVGFGLLRGKGPGVGLLRGHGPGGQHQPGK